MKEESFVKINMHEYEHMGKFLVTAGVGSRILY